VLKYRLFKASLFFKAVQRKSEHEALGGGCGEVSCQVSRLALNGVQFFRDFIRMFND